MVRVAERIAAFPAGTVKTFLSTCFQRGEPSDMFEASGKRGGLLDGLEQGQSCDRSGAAPYSSEMRGKALGRKLREQRATCWGDEQTKSSNTNKLIASRLSYMTPRSFLTT